MGKCPICKGEGKSLHVVINPYTKLKKTVVQWCLCMKSKYISESKSFIMLKWLNMTYMPLEEIDKSMKFDPEELIRCPNLMIQNTTYESFCLHVKSVLIKYHFIDPIPSIYLCKAMGLLKNFYVEQPDGSCPGLQDLNRFDLLIFTLDTLQHNEKLSTVVAEVINNRLSACKPTWIWIPKGVPLDNTAEVSDELKAMLRPTSKNKDDRYKKVHLEEKNVTIKSSNNKVKRKAEDFHL